MSPRAFPVLSILARVFDDGADEGMDDWLAWYNPTDWFHISRGLGVFIRQRMESKSSGLILIRPEPRCPTCHGPNGIMFNPNCPAEWAHRFIRETVTTVPPHDAKQVRECEPL